MPLEVEHNVVQTYNMMHVRFRVQVKWRIDGLKRKWRHFMKNFDSTKPKYSDLFGVTTSLTTHEMHEPHI
jgi:hypothetical protein